MGGIKSETYAILNMKITVLYDNTSCKAGLDTAWGFSCFIEGAEKTILFDTGSNPFLLLRNIKCLGIDKRAILDCPYEQRFSSDNRMCASRHE
jgi:hypothetical protein